VLEKSGYLDWSRQVTVGSGETVQVRATFTRAPVAEPQTGTLTLDTRPATRVVAGGQTLGRTPIRGATVRSGVVQLRLTDDRGQTHQRVVRVRPGENSRVFFVLDN